MTNLQGDVLRIVDASGNVVASYAYDPYGKVISATGTLAETNPIRYRGYYYDTETGFYYLQSRYYDPTICRFINADSYASTGQGILGYNMFAYCGNNPCSYSDSSGTRREFSCKCNYGENGSSPRYIYNQNNEPFASMWLGGLAQLSHGGCGPVATYNAMQMLGNYDTTMDDVLEWYKGNDAFLLFGALGSLPYVTVDYFRDHGYSVIYSDNIVEYEELAKAADACILWYVYGDRSTCSLGAHFAAFKQSENAGFYYNLWSDQTGAYKYSGTPSDFVDWRGLYGIVILIFDD